MGIGARSAIVAVVLSAVGCSSGGGPGGACDAVPLAAPVFRFSGATASEEEPLPGSNEDSRWILESRTAESPDGRSERLVLTHPCKGTSLTLTWTMPAKIPIDLRVGAWVEIGAWNRQGFEGTARGFRIDDERGPVLLVDDGAYGNAIRGDDLAPFSVAQEDMGCRNRRNTPDDLNNFLLVVSAGAPLVKLVHGQSAELEAGGAVYTVLAVRSTSRVGDVRWTDAPYDYKSFVIARR